MTTPKRPPNPNRSNSCPLVAARCAAMPDVAPFARIVGRWVWCEFPTRPAPPVLDWLKAEGFHWNKTRLAWQHPCGRFSQAARSHDPRATYGELPVIEGAQVFAGNES